MKAGCKEFLGRAIAATVRYLGTRQKDAVAAPARVGAAIGFAYKHALAVNA